ncbi:MAG: extracellular solute-binding protein, partial [Treponema sp.]|nr:extracellular solute-binding protein [Treponema sp.]
MKKAVFALLWVVVLLVPAFGGAKRDRGPAAAGKQTLVFWNVFTGSDGDILREICDNFNKTNTQGITIQVDIMPNDQLQQKLPAAIATNTAPDMVLFGIEYLAPYVNSGSLEDISDFWAAAGVDKSNFLESVVELSQVNGKLYGVPMQYNVQYLYWNKDLFKAAGLNPERPPATLAEFAEYAVKLTVPAKNQFGLALPIGVSYPHLLWANGGDINDPVKGANLLNSSQNLSTLRWLQDLTVNKKVTPINVTGPEADMMLQNGQVAMYMSGPWQINGLRSQGVNFGVGP